MKSPVILRIFKNAQLQEVRQFDKDQIVIGHEADVQLDLAGEGISPIHCLIEKRDSGYYICDLGSQTGTFKNGQAVLDDIIESGDEISVGNFRITFYVGVPKPKSTPRGGASGEVIRETVVETRVEPAKTETVVETRVESVAVTATPVVPAATHVEPTNGDTVTADRSSANVESTTSQPHVETAAEEETKPSIPAVVPPVIESIAAVKIQKPHIRPQIAEKKSKKGAGGSYAPKSEVSDLRESLKPGKGGTLEVIVAWKERIIDTYHFRQKGVYGIGQTDRDAIRIASDAVPKTWPLIEISNAVKINIQDGIDCEVTSINQPRRKLQECIASGKATRSQQGTSLRLDQNEMVCLSFGGGQINIYIRYAPQAPLVPMLPPLGLTSSELSGLIFTLVATAMLAFYISASTPQELMPDKNEELTRTAQIIFNNPPPKPPEPVPPPPPPPQPPKEVPPPPPPKKEPEKVAAATKKQENQKKGQSTAPTAAVKQVAQRANEVAPKPNSQNKPKTLTSVKSGGAIKLGAKAGANAASSKDVSKVGLFSAFGGGGVRSKLDQAYSGAGEVLGQADKATGSSGMGEDRPGDDLGSRIKDTGAGGKGTATQGIAGIGTKGRSSGMSAYGSVDGLGGKTTVNIESGGAEEDFLGTIDREAVRRVVKHYLHEIQGCYVRELNLLQKGQKLEGKVVISWEIVERGVAKNVKVKSSSLGNSRVENCIAQRLASWSFPEPPKGTYAEISYPFYLKQMQ